MTMLRRCCTVGALMLALFLTATVARAQALKQLPANALVVIKINNAQALNGKVAAMMEKLGLAKLAPPLADPLGAFKQQFNIKDGFNAAGEMAVGIYEPGPGEGEPRAVVLIPVSDFKAFMGSQANVKEEGGITSFTMGGDEGQEFYAANWDGFAAITPTRELLAQKPAGMEIGGLARKQLDTNDVTAYVNVKFLASKAIPAIQGNRPMILGGLEQQLKNNQEFNQKFTPVVRALVDQVLNIAEGALAGGQAATLGLNLGPDGVNLTVVTDFEPSSYAGQLMAGIKNGSDADLLSGLPSAKYFAFGGMVLDRKTTMKVLDDLLNPISKELANVGDDAKSITTMIDTVKSTLGSVDSVSFGYVVPTGAPGTQALLQQIFVYKGDARKMAAVQKQSMQSSAEMMKLMSGPGGPTATVDIKADAKSIDGATLDQFTMQFKFNDQDPAAAQAAQMFNILYGQNGLTGYMGAVDDKTYLVTVGVEEETLNNFVTTAKKNENPLAAVDQVKAVAAKLPQNRAAVEYIAVDNIVTTVVQYLNQFGMPVQLKLPADMPPVGVAMGTEGSSLRIDAHIASELIENLIAAAFQVGMQQRQAPQGGGL